MANTLVGQTIGKYTIIESVGSGGMAEVYRAVQQPLEREVALKVLHPHLMSQDELTNRFRREAKAVASLSHPHIIQIFDFDVAGENYFIAMAFLRGKSLEDHLVLLQAEHGVGAQMPIVDALEMTRDIADALDYSHRQGMVHRDVKPANIMRTIEGKAILTDFGIATMLDATRITRDGATSGTPAYMSPEQALGQQGDHRSDVYSLGAVLYELVTGRQPFESDTLYGLIMKQVNEPPPPPSEVNADVHPLVERVIEKAMAKDPEMRYQSAADFATDLTHVAQALAGQTVAFSPAVASTSQPTLIADIASISQTDLNVGRSTGPSAGLGAEPNEIKDASRKYAPVMYGMGAVLGVIVLGLVAWQFVFSGDDLGDESVASMADESVASMADESVASMADDGVASMADSQLNQPYQDDFLDNTAGWAESEGTTTRAIQDGVYEVQILAQGVAMPSMPEHLGSYNQFAFTAEATLVDGQPESGFGLIFHRQDAQNYYVFGINGNQAWSIWRLKDNEWIELRQLEAEFWSFDEHIHPAGETNVLQVEVIGDTFSLFVNNYRLWQYTDTDAPLVQGRIGFYTASSVNAADARAVVQFDNVDVVPIDALTVPAMTDG